MDRRARNGFTLIELTVVLFLIGIFLSVAVPNLDNVLFRSDLKSTARSLKAAVRVLRSKSIATGRYGVLCLDLDKNAYWGEMEPHGARDAWGRRPENEIVVPRRSLAEGIRIRDAMNIRTRKMQTGTLCSILNSKGVIEETVLHLTDRRDRVLTIVINAYTGRFSLYDEYVDVEYAAAPPQR